MIKEDMQSALYRLRYRGHKHNFKPSCADVVGSSVANYLNMTQPGWAFEDNEIRDT